MFLEGGAVRCAPCADHPHRVPVNSRRGKSDPVLCCRSSPTCSQPVGGRASSRAPNRRALIFACRPRGVPDRPRTSAACVRVQGAASRVRVSPLSTRASQSSAFEVSVGRVLDRRSFCFHVRLTSAILSPAADESNAKNNSPETLALENSFVVPPGGHLTRPA